MSDQPETYAEWREVTEQVPVSDHHQAEYAMEAWLAAAEECYQLAYGQRRRELTGKRVRTFDERGVHPFSVAYGALQQIRSSMPAELRDLITDNGAALDLWPSRILRWSKDQADADFRAEILAGGE